MLDSVLSGLALVNEILSAGIAVTAFSLLLYSLTFNPRERAARILALLLGCLAVVFATDAMSGTASLATEQRIWLRVQWAGISFAPVAYMHLSDALLAATGRPSRGRRRWIIRIGYLSSLLFFLAAGLGDDLVGVVDQFGPVAYLRGGPLMPVFVLYFALALAFAGFNLWRAYRRCLTSVSRRRMRYLIFGSIAAFLGVFPFLSAGGSFVLRAPLLTWGLLAALNLTVGVQIILMTYAVAYFGVSFPDRVVKSRLFQWLLRGPVVASTTLAVTVVIDRLGHLVGLENSRAVPLFMVATILSLQYLITLVRPTIERWLFYGQDRNDVSRLHLLEERLLTTGDLRQYLESILNAACDLTGATSAFVAAVGEEGVKLEVSVGPEDPLRDSTDPPPSLLPDQHLELRGFGPLFRWDRYWLAPLQAAPTADLVGVMGLKLGQHELEFGEETVESLALVRERAAVALTDRALQQEVFAAVDRLVPEVEAVQRMRAAARYGGVQALTLPEDSLPADADLVHLVRQALGHYWGGPRLTQSPLLRLAIVREAMAANDGNPVNALRAILRRAIERVRPPGERRFTGEWMLYNILEMKFLEGRKVREVAVRLAMSEADLYRKQKVAIERVARAMEEMEREARAAGAPRTAA
jgi:hypothetical protein